MKTRFLLLIENFMSSFLLVTKKIKNTNTTTNFKNIILKNTNKPPILLGFFFLETTIGLISEKITLNPKNINKKALL